MESSNCGENVQPVRARKKGRKMRRERVMQMKTTNSPEKGRFYPSHSLFPEHSWFYLGRLVEVLGVDDEPVGFVLRGPDGKERHVIDHLLHAESIQLDATKFLFAVVIRQRKRECKSLSLKPSPK